MYPIALLIIAVIASLIHLKVTKPKATRTRVAEVFLAYLLPLTIGVQCLVSFGYHFFYAKDAAQAIGFVEGCPLQYHLAMANLALGVAAIICIWKRGSYWLAVTIVSVISLLGTLSGTILANGCHNQDSSCQMTVFVHDLVLPVLLIVFMVIYGKATQLFKKSKKG